MVVNFVWLSMVVNLVWLSMIVNFVRLSVVVKFVWLSMVVNFVRLSVVVKFAWLSMVVSFVRLSVVVKFVWLSMVVNLKVPAAREDVCFHQPVTSSFRACVEQSGKLTIQRPLFVHFTRRQNEHGQKQAALLKTTIATLKTTDLRE